LAVVFAVAVVCLEYSNPIHIDDVAIDFPDIPLLWRIHPGPGRMKR
jgi:hypothetical protein